MIKEPPSLQEIKRRRKPLRNAAHEFERSMTPLERFAVWITDSVGSIGFFTLLSVWTAVWLLWNIYAPKGYRFDPFPSFVLWLFISNVIQLILLPLVMVGQNIQSRYSEKRAEIDLDVNLKSEAEIEAILEHLEYQNDLILKILKHVDKKEGEV